MRRILSAVLLFLLAFSLQAQTAFDEIKANRMLSANNYRAYPAPTAKLTPAPKGYEPFYISTYMRHGSRYLINPKDYTFPKETLLKADSLEMLTVTGKKTLEVVLRMAEMAENRLGELTPLGARQHRGIAERMYNNFPQIFSDSAVVDARSTVVIRCILSMTSECLQLQALNPALRIKNDASYHDMCFMNPPVKREIDSISTSDTVKILRREFEAAHILPQRLMKVLFKDEQYVKDSVDGVRLMKRLFDIASNMQSHDTSMELYSLFTDEECYNMWCCSNLYWYLTRAASPVTKGLMPYREAELLRNILDVADSAIKDGKTRASLRFGHESCLLPLVALLELDGYGKSYENLDDIYNSWRSYEIFPMAANVQFVFYRKSVGGEILVKVLLNEREVSLPVKSKLAPYYNWRDVEGYYRAKLNAYSQR